MLKHKYFNIRKVEGGFKLSFKPILKEIIPYINLFYKSSIIKEKIIILKIKEKEDFLGLNKSDTGRD